MFYIVSYIDKFIFSGATTNDNNNLRSVVQKQRHIIDELRTQCTDLASKLESISNSYSDQVVKLSHQLGKNL